MAKGKKTGGRKEGTPNKRTTELAEAASSLVNAGRAPLPEIVVLRKLGKERLIEIDEIAMALRTITGESARERLLQTVLAVIAAEDAEAAARAEGTPADDPDKDLPTADDVGGILKPEPPEEDSGDGEAA